MIPQEQRLTEILSELRDRRKVGKLLAFDTLSTKQRAPKIDRLLLIAIDVYDRLPEWKRKSWTAARPNRFQSHHRPVLSTDQIKEN